MAEGDCATHPDSSDHLAEMTLEKWKECWQGEDRGFHMNYPHPVLVEMKDILVNGRENIKIYFPLCGKEVDMFWMSQLGHTIIGTEISDIACKEFFIDNKIDYTESPLTNIPGTVFKSKDDKIKLYCCDFFDFTSECEGKFDAIWDRGSLFAMNVNDQKRYADQIVPLMDEKCLYLLELEKWYKNGVQHEFGNHINDDIIKELFDKTCTVENIYEKEMTGAFFDEINKEMDSDKYIVTILKILLK